MVLTNLSTTGINFKKIFLEGSPIMDCLFFDTLTIVILNNIHIINVF